MYIYNVNGMSCELNNSNTNNVINVISGLKLQLLNVDEV